MKDYIDRESLRNNLRRWAADLAYTYGPNDEYVKCLEEVDTIVEDAPAADVVEVRHGRWILDEDPHDGDCRCSVCRVAIAQMHEKNHGLLNALTGGKWWTFYNYCPNCGAKIDGGVDDGNS